MDESAHFAKITSLLQGRRDVPHERAQHVATAPLVAEPIHQRAVEAVPGRMPVACLEQLRSGHRWALDGTFTRMLAAVQVKKDAAGDIDWRVSVDSTVARAHQHAAGARKKGRSRGTKYVITPSDDPEAD